jgi:hypothetical protein
MGDLLILKSESVSETSEDTQQHIDENVLWARMQANLPQFLKDAVERLRVLTNEYESFSFYVTDGYQECIDDQEVDLQVDALVLEHRVSNSKKSLSKMVDSFRRVS